MLASHLTMAAQAPTSPLIFNATTITASSMLRTSTISARSRHHQQVRNFRFGLWSSYLDPTFQKELQRRHRDLKHKYAEALDRKLSWEGRTPTYASRMGFKGFMCSAWRGQDPRPGGRWIDLDQLKASTSAAAAAGKMGCGIEDVEQSAFDKLFSGDKNTSARKRPTRQEKRHEWELDESYRYSYDLNPRHNAIFHSFTTSREWSPRDSKRVVAKEPSNHDLEYIIDPITNRRVYKKPETVESSSPAPKTNEIPVKTFKGYRSQFSNLAPPPVEAANSTIHLDGAPPVESQHTQGLGARVRDFEKEQSYLDELTASKTETFDIGGVPVGEDVKKYTPYEYNEPDGKPEPKSDETFDVQEELKEYTPYKYNEPDGKSVEELEPVPIAEPYGDRSVEEDLKEYYPYKYNEPDGKLPAELEPKPVSEPYGDRPVEEDLKEYYPYKYNEPDGKFPEELEPKPISEPFGDRPVEEDLKDYVPYKYNEPDGQPAAKIDPVAESLNEYDGQSAHPWINQVDNAGETGLGRGKRAPPSERKAASIIEPSLSRFSGRSRNIAPSPSHTLLTSFKTWETDKREDLDLLRASDVRAASGILKGNRESEAEKQSRREALEADFSKIQESAGTSAEEIAAFEKIKEAKQRAEEFEIQRSVLLNHVAHAQGRVNARIAELESQEPILKSKPASSAPRKMTGNYVRDFPEEFNTTWTTEGSTTSETLVPKNKENAETGTGMEAAHLFEKENEIQNAENEYAAGLVSSEKYSRSPEPARLQTSLDRKQQDAPREQEQTTMDSYTKDPKGLELSYVKECLENGNVEPPVIVKSYGASETSASKEENRRSEHELTNARRRADRELIRNLRAIYEQSYGEITSKHRQSVTAPTAQEPAMAESVTATSAPPVAAPEPTLYKILAYDPTMQEINTAETTSIVADNSSALTPAEVLLRLSNPAKFFPHFAPLQAQGYEIVSGSGDVLVFRKVRAAAPEQSLRADGVRKGVNPIDGMQTPPPSATSTPPRAATGNFASPTGFVNHDFPIEADVEASTSVPFKSGIDVRREEPVFSGRKREWIDNDTDGEVEGDAKASGKGKKKGRVGRNLLLGAAWVGACSYAVGVVGEYFRTGGSDGLGPRGL